MKSTHFSAFYTCFCYFRHLVNHVPFFFFLFFCICSMTLLYVENHTCFFGYALQVSFSLSLAKPFSFFIFHKTRILIIQTPHTSHGVINVSLCVSLCLITLTHINMSVTLYCHSCRPGWVDTQECARNENSHDGLSKPFLTWHIQCYFIH